MTEVIFQDIQQHLQTELRLARNQIRIALTWFSNQELFRTLLLKLTEGVSVEVMLNQDLLNNRHNGLDWQDFLSRGGKLFWANPAKPILHKFCLIDRTTVLAGSYDWTYLAESNQNSALLLIRENQSLTEQFYTEYENLKDQCQEAGTAQHTTIADGLLYDFLGIKKYLAEDTYQQSVRLNAIGDTQEALNLLDFSAQIDAYTHQLQQLYNFELSQQSKNNTNQESENNYADQIPPTDSPQPELNPYKVSTSQLAQKIEQQNLSLQLLEQADKLLRSGQLEKAKQAFRKVLEKEPKNENAYLGLANVAWQQAKYQQQAEYAFQVLKIDDKNSKAYNMVGLAYDKCNNRREAIRYYNKAIENAPSNYSYYWNRAIAYKNLGQKNEMLADFRKVFNICSLLLKQNPNNAVALKTLQAAQKEIGVG